jgi:argininosuccinate synthase
LDTSIILRWLVDKGYDVIAFMADLGQEADYSAAEAKARKIGACDVVIVDLKREFVTDYIFPAIRGDAKYEGRYLLGTSLARPLIAKAQVDVAKKLGAKILSHGSTGKGNDQVRFELAYRTLMPGAKIYAPWKEPDFLSKFKGRDEMIAYADANGIPISQTKKDPWSSDDNLLHISYEGGMLEDPMATPFERMFKLTVSPKKAPDSETLLEIDFEKGNPVKVRRIVKWVQDERDGLIKVEKYGETITEPVGLFSFINKVAGENGVGRIDMVESRFVGMKSRGVYETPAGTVLHTAHRDIEGMTMDREVMRIRDSLIPTFAERIYSGFWFSPEMDYLQKVMDLTQETVSGTVVVSLYKGNVSVLGRKSDKHSLYNIKIASMHEEGGYDQTKARGFIDINAVRLQASMSRKK